MANRSASAAATLEPEVPEFENGRVVPAAESPLELVYRLHGKHLYRFLLRVTLGDRREAEDLLQETLLRAWRYLQDHGEEAAGLRPWLFTVARRIAIDASRARKARPTEVNLTDVGTIAQEQDDIERTIVALTMRQGLMSLSHDHRQVLIEIFYRGRTTREVAEALRIPEGTAKSRMHYALRALASATHGSAARA
jgi:RNA polymerase sigma-70 factor (ECF subfamily)